MKKSKKIRDAIKQNRSGQKSSYCCEDGMTTLSGYGVDLIKKTTTVSELKNLYIKQGDNWFHGISAPNRRIRNQSGIIRYPPRRRISYRDSRKLNIKILDNVLSSQAMDQLLSELLSEEKRQKYKSWDLDTSIGLEGCQGFASMLCCKQQTLLTLRILPDNLPNWQDLGLLQPLINLTTNKEVSYSAQAQQAQEIHNVTALSIAFLKLKKTHPHN